MADADEVPALIVEGGPTNGQEMKLTQGATIIVGSGRLADLRIDHSDIELAHIKVRWDESGLSLLDNGSPRGTWLNGVLVETAGLINGDLISFADPAAKSPAPRVRVKAPRSFAAAPPPDKDAAPAPPPVAARTQAIAGARARSGRARGWAMDWSFPQPDLRLIGIGALGLAVIGGGLWAVRLYSQAPTITNIAPAECEPGREVTITGRRFAGSADANTVLFGSLRQPATSVDDERLRVVVPNLPSGKVAVRVEAGRRTSNAISIVVLTPLRAAALAPPGAAPQDEVVIEGEGFADGATVKVGDASAQVLSIEPGKVRFSMPASDAARGSTLPVVVDLHGRRTSPLSIVYGRVPLVLSIDPPRGICGAPVVLRGAGFALGPAANAVTVDGVPALVTAATASELTVVLPPLAGLRPEVQAPVVVDTGGRASEPFAYPVVKLLEGTWVLRFIPMPAEGQPGRAQIVTEVAPVLLLASKAQASSVEARAERLAEALADVVERTRAGQRVVLEGREAPEPGVAPIGEPTLLLPVTPEDVAAYMGPARASESAAAPALARHWAAVLNDYITIATSGAPPTAVAAVSPAAGTAFSQLRAALPWEYRVGVENAKVAALPSALRQRLKEAALTVR